MARKFLTPIDLTKNELQNAVIQNLATAPSSPVTGQVYYNTVDNSLYIYNGTRWEIAGNAVASGSLALRPSATSVDAGTFYYVTDSKLFFYSDGSSWIQTNAFGTVTAQTSYGASSANGTSTDYARADHTHGTPALGTATPSAIAGVTGSAGSATVPSKEDHTHAFNPSTNLSMNSNKLTNLATPTDPNDAANKSYVDSAVAGLNWKASVNLLANTNVALTGSTGSLVIDGHTALDNTDSGYRLLLIGQSTATDNGIYVYTDAGSGYTLTRATDADSYTELIGAAVFVMEGTTYGSTSWVQSNHYLTSFAGQSWTQFSGAGTYTAGYGVQLVGNQFRLNPSSTGGLQTDATVASIKLATNSGLGTTSNGLAVGAGTGISVSSGTVAVDTSVVVRKYAADIGDGANTSITVTHNLGTKDVTVALYDNSSPYAEVMADVQHSTTNTITLLFSVAPTSNQYRVVVHG